MSYHDDDQRKKRIVIIGVSSFLLVALVVAVSVSVGQTPDKANVNDSGKQTTKDLSDSMKAIKSICQPTDYKATCEETLQKSAKNTTDPKELIKVAFRVAEDHINEAAKKSALLQELEKDPRTHGALLSCKDLMTMSISELKQSIEKVNEFDFNRLDDVIVDLKTWLSATVTYQETCLDGFENTTTNAGNKIKTILKKSMQLSANALDIVNGLSSALSSLEVPNMNHRRLLQDNSLVLGHGDQFPSWVDFGTRRLLSAPAGKIKADIIVAKDGSGTFKTIKDALKKVPKNRLVGKPFVIYIKQGVYHEYLQVNRSMTNFMIVGDGSDKTRITGNKNFVDGINTFRTSTVAILGDYFIAKNIGFENSAGAVKHQAVALRVSGDFNVFYNCSMDGYQDTLYTHAKRQFYRDCTISGTIDFVFGDAPVVFQNCKFLIRKPMENQQNIVTAQGRKQRRQPSAIVLHNCTITAHPELAPYKGQFKSYLGRPWKEYSRTIIMQTYIDDVIDPKGWLPWMGDFGLKTCWYAEYKNRGPGSNTKGRATWLGVKNLTAQHAGDFAPSVFLRNDGWIKKSGVPYSPNLLKL